MSIRVIGTSSDSSHQRQNIASRLTTESELCGEADVRSPDLITRWCPWPFELKINGFRGTSDEYYFAVFQIISGTNKGSKYSCLHSQQSAWIINIQQQLKKILNEKSQNIVI